MTISSAVMSVGFISFSLLVEEKVAESVEILLHNDTDALRVQTVAGEVAVVGLVIYIHCQIAVGEEQIAQVEVADEACRGVSLVAIAELSVYQKPVVEQTP